MALGPEVVIFAPERREVQNAVDGFEGAQIAINQLITDLSCWNTSLQVWYRLIGLEGLSCFNGVSNTATFFDSGQKVGVEMLK